MARAEWVRRRLVGFGAGVHSVVPSGFPAYVRVFHPADRGGPEPRAVRWAEVAERAGTTMHGLAQFAALTRPFDDPASSRRWDVCPPAQGNLDPESLAALCEVLARHTTTPAACWFCLWHGHGWLRPGGHTVAVLTRRGRDGSEVADAGGATPAATEPPVQAVVPTGEDPSSPARPLVRLPHREYLLFCGPVDAAGGVGFLAHGVFFPHSPNLFWPHDHVWCVATEIDLDSTYIAGDQALADDLLSDPHLEAWSVRPDDSISWDSDTVNR